MSNASPEYLTSSTGESTNSNGYSNKVSHINSLQDPSGVEVGVGSEYGAYSIQRRSSCGGDDLAGGGRDPRRERRLTRYRSCEGGMEGINGDFKFPLCRLHNLS